MFGLIYIILSFTVGWVICTYAFPALNEIPLRDYYKRKIDLSPGLLLIPAWYITGTLALTWATYLTALLFQNREEPLLYANAIIMPMAFLITTFVIIRRFLRKQPISVILLSRDRRELRAEILLVIAVTALAAILMWTTFFVAGDKLYIGVSVFSDFSPHVGMIRSFSYGNNFPTSYPHYAGEDIKYHFMFQFLAGNLEYLGMRIDYAFNLPSILSFISAFMLLYLLAVKITGKTSAGILSCLFFAFRSSKTLFTYLSRLPEGTNILQALADNMDFISDTPNEDWGLWNLNVYCNQRHLAFGLTVIFLVLILFLPRLYESFESLKEMHFQDNKRRATHNSLLQKLWGRMKIMFFTKKAWSFQDTKGAVAAGVLLGSLSFFHGAAVIGCLLVLFVMAVFSQRRFEHLTVALLTLGLSFMQTKLFIDGSAIATDYYFGFIAENKTLFGVASYIGRLLGILPIVILVAFCLGKGVERVIILAFSLPLVFAFTMSLTVDVTVNHKYIMMSCILLGIAAASLITDIFSRRDILGGFLGTILVFALTATGIYDFTVVLKKNTPHSAIVLDMDDPLTQWIDQYSDSKDIFLTSNYTINQVVFGGAMLYEGWPYYPWSAGYDTDLRSKQVVLMYEAETPKELNALIQKNKIRFIIVDRAVRTSEEYTVNEQNVAATYQCVYSFGQDDWKTSIYDTELPIYE